MTFNGAIQFDASGTLLICPSSFCRRDSMKIASVKEEARRLVEGLPDDATWEDLQYQIYFRQAVEAGLSDSQEGRIVPLEEARQRFGLATP
jgi:hypothetical protein